ncbi:MAG: class I SAM-dependent methyltransferase [Candidatus Woesearchaeota archaeon]
MNINQMIDYCKNKLFKKKQIFLNIMINQNSELDKLDYFTMKYPKGKTKEDKHNKKDDSMKKCPICESKKISFLMNSKDRLHAIKGTFTLWKCSQCSLVFLNPRPSPKLLNTHYPKEYHAYASYPDTKKNNLAIYLYNLYFGPNNSSISTLLQRIIFIPAKHLLRGTLVRSGTKILDVGCGSGAFLYKMKKLGMKTYGVEPSLEGCKTAKKMGLDVRVGSVEDQNFPSNYFDVITLNHVYEHVNDPRKTLRELKRILKKGGILIMAFPNTSSLQFKTFGKYWASIDSPRHLHIYSPKTIRHLSKIEKFPLEKIRYISFPFGIQASTSYIINRNKNIPIEKQKFAMSKLMYLMIFPIVYLLDFMHIGDSIEVVFRKK